MPHRGRTAACVCSLAGNQGFHPLQMWQWPRRQWLDLIPHLSPATLVIVCFKFDMPASLTCTRLFCFFSLIQSFNIPLILPCMEVSPSMTVGWSLVRISLTSIAQWSKLNLAVILYFMLCLFTYLLPLSLWLVYLSDPVHTQTQYVLRETSRKLEESCILIPALPFASFWIQVLLNLPIPPVLR